MEKNLPEIVFASSNKAESQRISRSVRSGRLRKLIPRVYTSNSTDRDAAIVSRNLYLILSRLFPGALLSHRTALEGGPTETGDIYLTYKYSRNVALPGIRVHLMKGSGALDSDMPFLQGLFMSSRPRAFVEVLQISRGRSGAAKTLPPAAIEARLDRICQIQGPAALHQLRDRARQVARTLGLKREFERLNGMIGSILGSRPARGLRSAQARARSLGIPYDPQRLEILNRLFSELSQTPLAARKEHRRSAGELELLAFFEAYFSNYIEGTEFEISEAYDIVFKHKIPPRRPQDAHDILGTFRVISNREDRRRIPTSVDDLLALLRSRHHAVMEGRPDRQPGEFKQQPNRAGETRFVAPELVTGTLHKGFEMYRAVEPGLARAIFMMFLVAEVHPFVDGNGRVARLMMNAELSRLGLSRILLPTVLRDDYLLALRALSRSDHPAPLLKVMDLAQRFSAQLPLTSYRVAEHALTQCNAFKESDEGRLRLETSP